MSFSRSRIALGPEQLAGASPRQAADQLALSFGEPNAQMRSAHMAGDTTPHQRPPQEAPATERLIWEGERRAFVAGTLRQAMLVRGFSPETLASAASVAHGTIYSALAGRPTRLRTARRILETLAAVEPGFLLADLR